MKEQFFIVLSSFILTVICGSVFVRVLRKKKIAQPIYEYVEEHKGKKGTPTAGGLFFIIPASLVFLLSNAEKSRSSFVALAIGIAFMLVGFLDDFIKLKSKKNEGLKPYQKIIFQVGIALIFGAYAYFNGITEFRVPFSTESVDFGVYTVFFDAFIFVATTNCVNLTDGIDGLASSVSLVYLLFLSFIIYKSVGGYDEYITLSVSLIGALSGFLVFNKSKASVFMGDTGSLSLGGFISALSILSGNGFYILILGIVFVLTGISVIIQVAYFKLTKKRVFLMAPFHHHLQMKGLSEEKIVYYYSLLTVLTGAVSLIF